MFVPTTVGVDTTPSASCFFSPKIFEISMYKHIQTYSIYVDNLHIIEHVIINMTSDTLNFVSKNKNKTKKSEGCNEQ